MPAAFGSIRAKLYAPDYSKSGSPLAIPVKKAVTVATIVGLDAEMAAGGVR